METSCLKNTFVADAFETLIELTNREQKSNLLLENKNIKLQDKKHNKKKKCLCKKIF